MKKTIKIIFAVFMSVLIICFSCVSAFADTTVDGTVGLFNKEYFSKRVEKTQYLSSSSFNLSSLTVDDYLTIFEDGYYTDTQYKSVFFIPTAGNYINYLEAERYYTDIGSDLAVNEIRFVYLKNEKRVILLTNLKSYTYCFADNNSKPLVNVIEHNNKYGPLLWFPVNQSSNTPYGYFINNKEICNFINTKCQYGSFVSNIKDDMPYCEYVSSLFSYFAQIIPGYTGAVYDSSLNHILENNGKSCDDSIIDKYKYQIYYSLNNDLRMVFLNNAYQPESKKDKFKGSNSDDAYKYKFHYNKTSDCIVYYPTFKMYLSYDDWYKFQPEDNTFKWWWEKDTKDFTLISDWKYSNGTYTGTRVATNWEKLNQLGESADFTAISSFITDKDKLLHNGWKDGRPTDTNYPYCIEVDYNGKAGLFIYSNSKPRVSKVDIISDTHKQFNIYMVGMYGYVYNAINNCYINYDFTIKDGQKNFVQQYLFKYFSYELHCLDSDLNLTLFENYKGSDNDYKGTRVFFNWDITQDLKLSADDLQKIQDNCKEDIGGFTDSNGNQHGGNLNNYSDEDKNKFNESGSNSDSTTDNNFDFSFDGIMNYCDSFFSFMQSAFSVFPASIWLLISLSIAMLVFLRVLGR